MTPSQKRAYRRRYAQENPEIVAAWKRRWYQRHRARILLQVKRYRNEFPERYRAAIDRWEQANPAKVRQAKAKWLQKNQAKRKAIQALNNAVRDGKITRPAECSKCGKHCIPHGHHHKGYSMRHRFDVEWLCAKCHKKAHS